MTHGEPARTDMGHLRRILTIASVLSTVGCALAMSTSTAIAGPTPWDELIRGPAGGEVVVEHQPHNTGGGAADTLYQESEFLPPTWQLIADDVVLSEPAVIGRIAFWGFYHFDSIPAGDETFRIRFYDARPADGLPGNTVFEATVLNPPRVATGRQIVTSGAPIEYLFDAVLPLPMYFDAESLVWLEIVQSGDLDSTFRWEFSLSGDFDQVFNNPVVGDWTPTAGDTAYQLITIPEPFAVLLMIPIAIVVVSRKPQR